MSENKQTPQEIVHNQLEAARMGSLISPTFLGELVIAITSAKEKYLFSAELTSKIENSSHLFADATTYRAVLALLRDKIIPEQKKPTTPRSSSTAAKGEGGIPARPSETNASGEGLQPPKPAPTNKK